MARPCHKRSGSARASSTNGRTVFSSGSASATRTTGKRPPVSYVQARSLALVSAAPSVRVSSFGASACAACAARTPASPKENAPRVSARRRYFARTPFNGTRNCSRRSPPNRVRTTGASAAMRFQCFRSSLASTSILATTSPPPSTARSSASIGCSNPLASTSHAVTPPAATPLAAWTLTTAPSRRTSTLRSSAVVLPLAARTGNCGNLIPASTCFTTEGGWVNA